MAKETPYPRPDLARDHWQSLDGEWQFCFDAQHQLKDARAALAAEFGHAIQVPFCYQSRLSGIGEEVDCDTVWYRRTFTVADETPGRRTHLHFGAVDYEARVWVNGSYAGSHRGGHTPFEFDITGHLVPGGENTLLVKVADPALCDRPRGKQSWQGHNFACWYTPTTGIWQSVWLTTTAPAHITQAHITPDLDACTARVEVKAVEAAGLDVRIAARWTVEGVPDEARAIAKVGANGRAVATLHFPDYDNRALDGFYWSPEHPNLIAVEVALWVGEERRDKVDTYFGMRKISRMGGRLLLNNRPYFQRLVLDQGYWPDSLLTPPSDDAIRRDIELTRAMGFNGARKHQKIEDPRYYYWADRLGLLVWGELPSAYEFNAEAVQNGYAEMAEFVARDYNHPCIVLWVPLNESWGVRDILHDARQQSYAKSLYHMLKALDPTRLVSTNDGWEQVAETDICALHDYALFPDNLDKYDDPAWYTANPVEHRMPWAEGNSYGGQPVLLTEYGGVAFASGGEDWGYYEAARGEEEFLARLRAVTGLLTGGRGRFAGFCYTQLTDVMQEVNGLLDMDRNPKAPPERLKEIFGRARY